MGFNARNEKYEDMIKSGILDPTKVVRIALQNAVSIAGLLLTTLLPVAICIKPSRLKDVQRAALRRSLFFIQ